MRQLNIERWEKIIKVRVARGVQFVLDQYGIETLRTIDLGKLNMANGSFGLLSGECGCIGAQIDSQKHGGVIGLGTFDSFLRGNSMRHHSARVIGLSLGYPLSMDSDAWLFLTNEWKAQLSILVAA